MMQYFCCQNSRRRAAIIDHPVINGIDFVEVDPAQTTLYVHLINPVPADTEGLNTSFSISGGERIKGIAITEVYPQIESGQTSTRQLAVRVDRPGDFSIYTLSVGAPLANVFDPLLSSVDFSFKIHCDSTLDCRSSLALSEPHRVEPEIDYLAKDYASFRRLMLDRLTLLMPDLQTSNAADLSTALVELLAYVGDHLSYRQDAVATEAYLHTARRRVSVRRHARLLDYFMHDGANARAWVQIQVAGNSGVRIPQGARLLTRLSDRQEPVIGESEYRMLPGQGPEVFETLHDAVMYEDHNEMNFYTWGADECFLQKGAVRATLNGRLEHLQPGDVLIFKEAKGPETGAGADADPLKRHPVRLIAVDPEARDPLGGRLTGSGEQSLPVTEIEWHPDDALPFSFRVSTATTQEVSVALGNMVLADHGRRVSEDSIGPVPEINPVLSVKTMPQSPCIPVGEILTAPRFRPELKMGPLTCTAPCPMTDKKVSAAQMFHRDMGLNLPEISLTDDNGEVWQPQRDLFNSDALAEDFVVETESDGRSYLRFGDGVYGRRPPSGSTFRAVYRVGNGRQGNVGAGAIAHIVQPEASAEEFALNDIKAVANPLAAGGGMEPETIESVRRRVPYAYRSPERAVTPKDYARMAEHHPEVQKAVARLRWTGSWYTVFVAVDRRGRTEVDAEFKERLRSHLEPYRMAGHDIEIENPRYVALKVTMEICVKPDHTRYAVHEELRKVFSNRQLPDGRLGLFHPDNFTFGQPVYLSRLYAAAAQVTGVESVLVVEFRRQDCARGDTAALKSGRVDIGTREIARLENNPTFPERGLFDLKIKGGI